MKPITITVPIYEQKVSFVICSKDEYERLAVKYSNAPHEDADARFFNAATVERLKNYHRKKSVVFLWIDEDMQNKDAKFIHELFHVTKEVLYWSGLQVSDESEEAFAYLQEYLYTKFKPILDAYEKEHKT